MMCEGVAGFVLLGDFEVLVMIRRESFQKRLSYSEFCLST